LLKNSLTSAILDPWEVLKTKSKSLITIKHSQFDFEFTKKALHPHPCTRRLLLKNLFTFWESLITSYFTLFDNHFISLFSCYFFLHRLEESKTWSTIFLIKSWCNNSAKQKTIHCIVSAKHLQHALNHNDF